MYSSHCFFFFLCSYWGRLDISHLWTLSYRILLSWSFLTNICNITCSTTMSSRSLFPKLWILSIFNHYIGTRLGLFIYTYSINKYNTFSVFWNIDNVTLTAFKSFSLREFYNTQVTMLPPHEKHQAGDKGVWKILPAPQKKKNNQSLHWSNLTR